MNKCGTLDDPDGIAGDDWFLNYAVAACEAREEGHALECVARRSAECRNIPEGEDPRDVRHQVVTECYREAARESGHAETTVECVETCAEKRTACDEACPQTTAKACSDCSLECGRTQKACEDDCPRR